MNENQIEMIHRFSIRYKDSQSGLNYSNSFELLIATMLSAQSTDVHVNKVTAGLFSDYSTPTDFIRLGEEELAFRIKSIGLYRNKSKNIIKTCHLLKEKFNGKVPNNLEDLILLPGVGRKTASVVLCNAFSIPAFAVDTHVFRVTNRIGLASSKTVEETEKQMRHLLDSQIWCDAHHWFIWHGRRICKARTPLCNSCFVNDLCPWTDKSKYIL